jgi:polyisoprenoid-binding protein YceI
MICARAFVRAQLLLALAVPLLGRAANGEERRFLLDPAGSRIVVHVFKRGMFAPFLHDHDFVPSVGGWRGGLTLDPERPEHARVDLWFDAGGLLDTQQKISAADRTKVDAQVRGPGVLDASRFPSIRFTAGRFEPSPRQPVAGGTIDGTLIGTLSLHGRNREVRVPLRAAVGVGEVRAAGEVRIRQSDFGIAPYRRAAGALGVEDEVVVRFDLRLPAATAH